MKLKTVFIILIIILITVVTVFVTLDLLTNVNSHIVFNLSECDNAVNYSKVSIRDLNDKNATSFFNNNTNTTAGWVVAVAAVGAVLAIGGIYGLMLYCTVCKAPIPNQDLELEYL